MFAKLSVLIFKDQLTTQQKKATAILSIGTFLEYFDLYLYVHMASFMDKLFFPSHAKESWFLSNLALCSTFIFRPIGALLLGWLGDNLGRKSTIFISTTVTSICCLVTAYLPTYDNIGIKAAYILTTCRLLQSMLSAGEVQGARVYLIETTNNIQDQCTLSGIVNCFTTVGRFTAVAVANVIINLGGHSWRKVFLAGAIVALVGAYARSSLKETQEFADAKKRLKKSSAEFGENIRESHPLLKIKSDKKDVFYLFILKCGEALTMFFAYTYCAKALIKAGISTEHALNYATCVSVYDAIVAFSLLFFVLIFDPIKIIKFKVNVAVILFMLIPILLKGFNVPLMIFSLQIAFLTFEISDYPASPILYKKFPVLQRFTSVLMISALSRAFIWPISIYGINYLAREDVLGHYGLYIIFVPMAILSLMAIKHFSNPSNKNISINEQNIKTQTAQNV